MKICQLVSHLFSIELTFHTFKVLDLINKTEIPTLYHHNNDPTWAGCPAGLSDIIIS